jgi:hypothetical protein
VIGIFLDNCGGVNKSAYGDGKEDFVVAESIEAALELAKVKLLTSHFSLLTLDKMLMH